MNKKKIIILQPLVKMKDLLKKSLTSLEEEKLDELGEMGAIQAFEVSYELAYKICRKILSLRGTHVYTSKEVFRIAGLEGLIPNAEP